MVVFIVVLIIVCCCYFGCCSFVFCCLCLSCVSVLSGFTITILHLSESSLYRWPTVNLSGIMLVGTYRALSTRLVCSILYSIFCFSVYLPFCARCCLCIYMFTCYIFCIDVRLLFVCHCPRICLSACTFLCYGLFCLLYYLSVY